MEENTTETNEETSFAHDLVVSFAISAAATAGMIVTAAASTVIKQKLADRREKKLTKKTAKTTEN